MDANFHKKQQQQQPQDRICPVVFWEMGVEGRQPTLHILDERVRISCQSSKNVCIFQIVSCHFN